MEIDFNTLKNRQSQQPSYDPEVYDDIDVASSDNRYSPLHPLVGMKSCTNVRIRGKLNGMSHYNSSKSVFPLINKFRLLKIETHVDVCCKNVTFVSFWYFNWGYILSQMWASARPVEARK